MYVYLKIQKIEGGSFFEYFVKLRKANYRPRFIIFRRHRDKLDKFSYLSNDILILLIKLVMAFEAPRYLDIIKKMQINFFKHFMLLPNKTSSVLRFLSMVPSILN